MLRWNGWSALLLRFHDSGSHTSLCREITCPSFPGRVGTGVSVTEPRSLCLTSQVVPMQEAQRELSGSSRSAFIRILRNKGPKCRRNVLHPGFSRNSSVHSALPESGPGWAWWVWMAAKCPSLPVGQSCPRSPWTGPVQVAVGEGSLMCSGPQSFHSWLSLRPAPGSPFADESRRPVLQVVSFRWVTGMCVHVCRSKHQNVWGVF